MTDKEDKYLKHDLIRKSKIWQPETWTESFSIKNANDYINIITAHAVIYPFF